MLRWKARLDLQNSHFPLKVSPLDHNTDESHFKIPFAILCSCYIFLYVQQSMQGVFLKKMFSSVKIPAATRLETRLNKMIISRNNQCFVADETTEKSNVTFHNEENELNMISLKSLSYKFCSMHMVSEVSFEFSKASVVVHNVIVCCPLHYFLSQLLIKDLKRNFFSFEIND